MELPQKLRGNAEKILAIRALGLDVDDDNEPAPENIPNGEANEHKATNVDQDQFAKFGQGHGMDWQKVHGINDVNTKINGIGDIKMSMDGMKASKKFLHLFPTTFLKEKIFFRQTTI